MVKPSGLSLGANLGRKHSMPEKVSWGMSTKIDPKSRGWGYYDMDRFTNLYQLSRRVRSPGSVARRSDQISGSWSYVVLHELESRYLHASGGCGKLGRVLNHKACKNGNSGSPENRKVGGDGGIIVRGVESGTILKPWQIGRVLDYRYCTKRWLSGHRDDSKLSIDLNKVKEQVGNNTNQKVTGLSDVLANPDFLIGCWTRLRSKPAAVTRALDNETLDGIDIEWFNKTAGSIKNGGYVFRPSRSIYIPKKCGRKRPLNIPNPRDKVVVEGMRFLLEIVLENKFSNVSHGFRPKRGCHSALNQIRTTFGGVNWFIEGDIKQMFDSVRHKTLMTLAKEHVADQPFLDMLYKYLKTGYGTDILTVVPGHVGVPQGGVLSPLLSNLYLNELDLYVENVLRPTWNIGVRRKANPMYTKITRSGRAPKDWKINPLMGRDSQYKRLRYVRYADDFLLGVIGSKEDCTEIIGCLEKWLKSERDLVLNLDKTKITHSRDDSASFLGYNIHLTKSCKKPRRHVVVNNKHKLSLLTPRPLAPTNECVKKLTEQGYARGNGAPTKCGRLIHLTAGDIVRHYLTLEQGLLAYYGISSNFGHFSARIHYILKYSCALTLCSKLRLRTLRKTFRKFGKNLTPSVNNLNIRYIKMNIATKDTILPNELT